MCLFVCVRAGVRACKCVCVHLAYETLTSTYIMCFPYGIFCASTHTYTHLPKFMCMRVVNAYVCVHRHVHTRMRIFLIQNTHLPIACIRMLYVCACVCIHKYTHVYKYRLFSSIKYTLICVCIPLMCVKVSRYICVHTYTEIHVCIRVVYMYVCVHAHVHTRIRST